MKREGIVYGLGEAEYHAPKDELSSTGAKLLLEAPAKFKHQVIDGHRVHRDAYDLGSAVHAKALGVGSTVMEYPVEHLTPSGNVSTGAKTVAWATEQREQGFVLIPPKQTQEVNAMHDAIMANPDARVLLEADGDSEVSAFADCTETGVRLRARADRLPKKHNVIIDIKTVAGSADEVEFAKTIFNIGYDVSAGHYIDVFNYVEGHERDFAFIVVEKTAPYLVNVITMTHAYIEMGRTKSMEARRRYARGVATGEWPGYSGLHRVEPPMFAVYDFQDKYESGEIQIA